MIEGPLEIHHFVDQQTGAYTITINQVIIYQSVFRLGAGRNPLERIVVPTRL